MELLVSLLAVFFSICCSVLLLFFVRASSSSKSPTAHRRHCRRPLLPPGPTPLPVIGSLLELGDSPHRALARLAARHGPLISLRLGRVTAVVASSPAAARAVLKNHDAALSARSVPDAVRARAHPRSSIAWLPPSPRWRRLRGVCAAELFAPQRLDAQRPLRRAKIRELRDHVAACVARGSAVDVGRAAFATSLNLLSRTIFSVDLVDLRSGSSSSSSGEFKAVVEEIMAVAGSPNVSDFFPAIAAVDLQGRRRRMAVLLGKLHRIFDEQIDRRLRSIAGAGESPAQDFLSVLLKCRIQEDDGPPAELDRPALRSLFAAGSDTSSSTVEWAMAELLRSPRAMAAAREELARVIGVRREVEESDVARLPYLQAVVKETLRLHPPVPLLLPRRAVADVEAFGGHTIPAGAQVLVNVWAIGRDPAVWARPEEFAPERFTKDDAKETDFRGKDFELLPFGAGRRICPGLPLAVRMVHLMLAALLHGFEWRLPEGGDGGIHMTEKFGVTLTMAVPLRAMAVSD